MTDEELIARLREIQGQAGLFTAAAADRIEELEAKNKRLRLEAVYANDTADAAIKRAKELEAKLDEQDDLVQAAKRLAEYLNGDHIYMERVYYLATIIREGGE